MWCGSGGSGSLVPGGRFCLVMMVVWWIVMVVGGVYVCDGVISYGGGGSLVLEWGWC